MKFQAHRGVSSECPENTMAAFRAAVEQKYDIIELDPKVTADGKIVVLHDNTLNRTCRHADGSPLEMKVNIRDISYEEALAYDAGLYMGLKYKGEKIPLLSEVLNFAAQSGVAVKIDNVVFRFSEREIERIFALVRESGAIASVTCPTVDRVRQVFAALPEMPVHYDGPVTEAVLNEISGIVGKRFYAWVPMKLPQTSWCTVPFATSELCDTVRKYADLGLWILSSPEELSAAEGLGAGVIETTGVLKKPNPVKGFYDTHCHTEYSPDSKAPLPEMIRAAEEKGLSGIAVTDHCELRKIPLRNDRDGRERIRRCVKATREISHSASIDVFTGVELGGGILFPAEAEAYCREMDFDNLIVTRHGTMFDRYNTQARVDFSVFTEEELDAYIKSHYDDVLQNLLTQDLDIVAHLSSPLRYIVGKYGISVDLGDYSDRIDAILKAMVARGVALEANTSNLNSLSYAYNELMPDRRIFERYRELGGYLVTLGSDAHSPDRVGNQFSETWQMLKEVGFPHLYYFKNRIAIPYDPQM